MNKWRCTTHWKRRDQCSNLLCWGHEVRLCCTEPESQGLTQPARIGQSRRCFRWRTYCVSFAVVNEDLLELTLGTLLIHPVWEQQAPDKQRAWRPEESKRRIKKKQRVTVIQSCGDRVAIKCSGIIKTNGIRQLRPQLIYWVVSDTCFMSIHSCYMFDENRELSDLRLIVTSLRNSRQVMHRIEACNPEVNSYSR